MKTEYLPPGRHDLNALKPEHPEMRHRGNTGLKMQTDLKKTENDDCIDLHISIPCELANRVRGYAEKNGTSVTNVLIEALDAFIRSQKTL